MDADLVLEGGGVKGIGLVGAYTSLMQAGYEFHRVAGTSAGAIVGSLIAADMPPERLRQVMREVDYGRFEDKGFLDHLGLVGKGLSLLFEKGIYEGEYLREWLDGLLTDLGLGLAALHADLVDRLDDLTVVVMTEFGRRAAENASLGTDHGHGGAMLVLGGGAEGGRVHAQWPGMEPEQLFGPGDLAVTIDYRDVLAEVCLRRLNNPALGSIFPDFSPVLRGIVRPRG